ncbi:MAG: hypothetical protein MHM6MM_007749 [Cercozoa sp. M6MM]
MSGCGQEYTEMGGHCHHHGAGGCGCDHSRDTKVAEQAQGRDLFPHIEVDKTWCLNEHEDDACKAIFRPVAQKLDEVPPLQSDFDEDDDENDPHLLLHVQFDGVVALRSMKIISDAVRVKVWKNRADLDFDEAVRAEADQTFDVAVNDLSGELDYFFKASHFQHVTSLLLLITKHDRNNQDEVLNECVEVRYVGFFGDFRHDSLQRAVATVYEASAQLKDHSSARADSKQRSYIS